MKKKNNFLLAIILIFVLLVGSFFFFFNSKVKEKKFCYQESANIPNQVGTDTEDCSLKYNGESKVDFPAEWSPLESSKVSNLYDGDWNTVSYGAYGSNNGPNYYYVNYTKPKGALNSSLWQIKRGREPHHLFYKNVSIPENCWNYDSKQLILRMDSPGVLGIFKNTAECYDGEWNFILNPITNSTILIEGAREIYEEGMWWFVEQ